MSALAASVRLGRSPSSYPHSARARKTQQRRTARHTTVHVAEAGVMVAARLSASAVRVGSQGERPRRISASLWGLRGKVGDRLNGGSHGLARATKQVAAGRAALAHRRPERQGHHRREWRGDRHDGHSNNSEASRGRSQLAPAAAGGIARSCITAASDWQWPPRWLGTMCIVWDIPGLHRIKRLQAAAIAGNEQQEG